MFAVLLYPFLFIRDRLLLPQVRQNPSVLFLLLDLFLPTLYYLDVF